MVSGERKGKSWMRRRKDTGRRNGKKIKWLVRSILLNQTPLSRLKNIYLPALGVGI
jgi:hypothetical protein